MKKVVTNEVMREYDAKTIKEKTSAGELMLRAAKGLLALSNDTDKKIAVVCGPGNNGGDGYALAMLLNEANKSVEIYKLSDKFSDTSKFYYDKCEEQNIPIFTEISSDLNNYDLIYDCIFGTGFHGNLEGIYKVAVDIINAASQHGRRVISADIPSGINGNTGLGDVFVKADTLMAIGNDKVGYYLNRGKDTYNKIKTIDIGINIPNDECYNLLEAADIKEHLKIRSNLSNKGTYGYVGLLGGSKNYCGAAKLANIAANHVANSIAALRSGCGVVKLIVPAIIGDAVRSHILESTCVELPCDDEGYLAYNEELLSNAINNLKALGFGMGLGQGSNNIKILEYLLASYKGSLIIDADGLNTLAKLNPTYLDNCMANIILTPHLKEFSRLTGFSIDEIKENSIELAKDYALRHNLVLLLKGPTTIVTDGNIVYLVDKGCAGMATAGSGDVLSGILAGLCGYLEPTAMTVAIGAYINGYSGMLAQEENGDISMLAGDTTNNISKAIKIITG